MNDEHDAALESIENILETMETWVRQVVRQVEKYDSLGDAKQHQEGSEKRRLSEFRDAVEVLLSHRISLLNSILRERARTSRNVDLIVTAVADALGDGRDALKLMEHFHRVYGDETSQDGSVPSETFPDSFVWDTYHRVIALNDLVEKFPNHIRHSARQMPGWPMILSYHLDSTREFQRIAEHLEIGKAYPLHVGPRKKRGVETAILRYLEPRVWQIYELRKILHNTEKFWEKGTLVQRVRMFMPSEFTSPEHDEETVNIFVRVPDLPNLTRASAPQWSREIIVPLIMLQDAKDPETCEIPVLREIWRHKSVKSRATFESRLHSRVTDTLRRYAPEEPADLRGIDD